MEKSTSKVECRRRKLIKVLASGSVIAAAGDLPRHWSKPVVDSVMLPVHAQTSGDTFFGSQFVEATGSAPVRGGSILSGVLGAFVPSAEAGVVIPYPVIVELMITETGNGSFTYALKGRQIFPCGGSTGENSVFFSGAGSSGVHQSITGTPCDGGSLPGHLHVDLAGDIPQASGDIDLVPFNFAVPPGDSVVGPSPCLPCPSEEVF
jgi:hypothetical protein